MLVTDIHISIIEPFVKISNSKLSISEVPGASVKIKHSSKVYSKLKEQFVTENIRNHI